MRGLKVFLFISFLVYAIFGLIGLFAPALLSQWGMAGGDDTYVRVVSSGAVGFAVGLWYAFRNPLKSIGIIIAAIVWLGLEALVLLISGIAGTMPWANALPGIIFDAILTAGLIIFYPRGQTAT